MDELSVKNLSWRDETKVGAGSQVQSYISKKEPEGKGRLWRQLTYKIPQKIKEPVWLKSCLSPNKLNK
jgi:hypothetical protein